MHTFEVYFSDEEVTASNWQKLLHSIASYLGTLKAFELYVNLTDNSVRVYIVCSGDLSSLSNDMESFVLRAVAQPPQLPDATRKERFLRFVTGGNLLDFREKYAVKHQKSLDWSYFKLTKISSKKWLVSSQYFFSIPGNIWSVYSKMLFTLPTNLLAMNFEKNSKYLKKPIPQFLNIEKSLSILGSEPVNAIFKVDGFPYFTQEYYVNLGSFDFDLHSLIVGATGSGKSKLIQLMIESMANAGLQHSHRVVVIDPHDALADDLAHIPNSKVINYANSTSELFPNSHDPAAATELSTTLFKSLLGDQFNGKLERVLRFSLFVLFSSGNMNFSMFKAFLTNSDVRNDLLSQAGSTVPTNIQQFFLTDFRKLQTESYNEAIEPLVALIEELELLPTMQQQATETLASSVSDNFLTVFSMNKIGMGEKTVKTIAGLLIQSIFMLAQSGMFNQKVILIIDEISVVQNPTIASILAEARKFNLFVVITQQYLAQVDVALRDSIFANTYNYFVFKVSEEDAAMLEKNIQMEIPDDQLTAAKSKGVNEATLRMRFMTELHPREAIVRLSSNGQFQTAMKVETVDAQTRPKTAHATTQKPPALKPVEPEHAPQQPVETTDLPSLDQMHQETVQVPSAIDILYKQSSSRETQEKGDSNDAGSSSENS